MSAGGYPKMAVFQRTNEKFPKPSGEVSTKSKRRLERPLGRFWCKIERPRKNQWFLALFPRYLEKYAKYTYKVIHFWNQHEISRQMVYSTLIFEQLYFFLNIGADFFSRARQPRKMTSKTSQKKSVKYSHHRSTVARAPVPKKKKRNIMKHPNYHRQGKTSVLFPKSCPV